MRRALLLLIVLVPGAWAHAEPYQSDPAGGSRLEVAPDTVWVDFTEPVHRDGSWIRVVDQDGRRVDADDLEIIGERQPRMQVSLQDVGDGAYSIQWQTFSKSDGHTIRGTIGFAVGGFAPPATTEDAEAEFDLGPALARAVLYAGISLGVGALAYGRLVGPVPFGRRGALAGVALAGAGTLLLAVDSWRSTGLSLGEYAGGDAGIDFAWRLGLIGLTGLAMGHAWVRVLGWGAFTWMTASFGHITTQGAWAVGLEWLHLVAAATWIGGLFFFMLSLRRGVQDGPRFTRLAQWAVVGIIVTGSVITASLVGRMLLAEPGRLFSDSWAWFLLIKLAAVVAMLVLAAINRYVFLDGANALARWVARRRPGLEKEDGLRRTVRLEAGISILTLLAAGLLLSVSPPAAEAFDQSAVLERTAQGNTYVALMRISPTPEVGQSHEVRFFITEDATGEPLRNNTCGRDDCVRMRWSVDGNASSGQEVALVSQGDGWWKAEDVLFLQAGSTTVEVDVQSAYVYLDALVFEPFEV